MQLATNSTPVANRATRRHPGKPLPEPITWPTNERAPWEDISAPATPNFTVPRKKVPQPLEALNYPQAHIHLATLLPIIGLGRSTWYRMVADGTAPQQLRFGARCSRWLASDISKFLADRAVQGVQK